MRDRERQVPILIIKTDRRTPNVHQVRSLIPNMPQNHSRNLVHRVLRERASEPAVRGLEEGLINQMPSYKFEGSEKTEEQKKEEDPSVNQCMVCLCEFEKGEELRTLMCLHRFHTECIDKWLKSCGACPICKCELSKVGNANA